MAWPLQSATRWNPVAGEKHAHRACAVPRENEKFVLRDHFDNGARRAPVGIGLRYGQQHPEGRSLEVNHGIVLAVREAHVSPGTAGEDSATLERYFLRRVSGTAIIVLQTETYLLVEKPLAQAVKDDAATLNNGELDGVGLGDGCCGWKWRTTDVLLIDGKSDNVSEGFDDGGWYGV